MKFLVGILTSDDTEKLQRAIKSVGDGIDILVISNTLDASYAEKAQKVAEKHGCKFIETESNGTPGRGKQSVLDYFNTTEYDYLIPIDGDDYVSTVGISRIINMVDESGCDVLAGIGQHMSDGKDITNDLFKHDMFAYKKWSISEIRSWQRFVKTLAEFKLPSKMVRFICLSKNATTSFRYRDDFEGSEDMYAACEVYSNSKLKIENTDEEIYIYDFDNDGAFWKFYSNQAEIDKTTAALEELYESTHYITISSKTPIKDVLHFAMEADGVASENMYSSDWETNPATFLYKLYVQKVFDEENKGFYVAYVCDGKIVAGSGLWRLHDTNYCIHAARAFTLTEYKSRTRKFWQWYTKKIWEYGNLNYDGYIACFNQYNRDLFETGYEINNVEPTRVDKYLYIKDRVFIPYKKWNNISIVNYTPQFILYNSINKLSELETYLGQIETNVRI